MQQKIKKAITTILHNVTNEKWVRPLALEVDYT